MLENVACFGWRLCSFSFRYLTVYTKRQPFADLPRVMIVMIVRALLIFVPIYVAILMRLSADGVVWEHFMVIPWKCLWVTVCLLIAYTGYRAYKFVVWLRLFIEWAPIGMIGSHNIRDGDYLQHASDHIDDPTLRSAVDYIGRELASIGAVKRNICHMETSWWAPMPPSIELVD